MKMRQFLVFPYPEEAVLAPSWVAGAFGMERMKEPSQRRRVGVCWQATGKTKWKSWIKEETPFAMVKGLVPAKRPLHIQFCG